MASGRSFEWAFVVAISAALVALVTAPLLVVLIGAVCGGDVLGVGGAPASLAAFRHVLTHYGAWIGFSLQLALLSVALCIALATPAAYVLVQRPFPGSALLEEVALLPLSLPGIAMSMALLTAYPRVAGPALVGGGHLLYTLPLMLRVLTSTLRQADLAAQEDAARSLGASFLQRLWLVVLPTLRHALIVGSLLVFAVSWGEFNVSYLLNAGHPQTFPAALYDTYTNDGFDRSSAATVLFLAVVLPASLAIQWIGSGELVEQAA